jgi:hypothetical protein
MVTALDDGVGRVLDTLLENKSPGIPSSLPLRQRRPYSQYIE